jgi:uncharacterized membrane protein YraQ (UPF0718 family)
MIIHALWHALRISIFMGWEILWSLILGFGLSGAVQAVVSHKQISELLPDNSLKSLTKASFLGAASSSCSYAAVALARTIFKKGANFTASMAFEVSSTNLVIELSIIIVLLLGWQFAAAEFVGGPIMIIVLALIFHRFLSTRMTGDALKQAKKGLPGRMEGHAAMNEMSVEGTQSPIKKLLSPAGRASTSHYFVMDWASIWTDIIIGLLIAGALSAWVPHQFWQTLFFSKHPFVSDLWGPLIGPLIAVMSFVCSVGNVPLAAVLWRDGISFGGVVSFIFADLIILPIIRIYAKYYGKKMAGFLFISLYAASAIAGYIVEGLWKLVKLTPHVHDAKVVSMTFSWNYTTILNILFLFLAAYLVWRFMRTGGPKMLKLMNR